MGVPRLWEIVQGGGVRISLQTLRYRRLAIGTSANFKALLPRRYKHMADEFHQGDARRERPVFVFDGPTPSIKKRTTAERKQLREKSKSQAQTLAEQLLMKKLQLQSVKQLKARLSSPDMTMEELHTSLWEPEGTEDHQSMLSERAINATPHEDPIEVVSDSEEDDVVDSKLAELLRLREVEKQVAVLNKGDMKDYSTQQLSKLVASGKVTRQISEISYRMEGENLPIASTPNTKYSLTRAEPTTSPTFSRRVVRGLVEQHVMVEEVNAQEEEEEDSGFDDVEFEEVLPAKEMDIEVTQDEEKDEVTQLLNAALASKLESVVEMSDDDEVLEEIIDLEVGDDDEIEEQLMMNYMEDDLLEEEDDLMDNNFEFEDDHMYQTEAFSMERNTPSASLLVEPTDVKRFTPPKPVASSPQPTPSPPQTPPQPQPQSISPPQTPLQPKSLSTPPQTPLQPKSRSTPQIPPQPQPTTPKPSQDSQEFFKPRQTSPNLQTLDRFESELGAEQQALERQLNTATMQAATLTDEMVEECKELLRYFGIPYISSPGEADAQCVELERLGLVDGIISDDSDILVFGGQTVFRHAFSSRFYPTMYTVDEIKKQTGLGSEELFQFPFLLGGDYVKGLKRVGPKTAVQIVRQFRGGVSGLVQFREWMQNPDEKSEKPIPHGLIGLRQRIRLPTHFPQSEVVEAYLHPLTDHSQQPFSWKTPDVEQLRGLAKRRFEWTMDQIDRTLLPVLELAEASRHALQPKIDVYFLPALPVKRTKGETTPSKRKKKQ